MEKKITLGGSDIGTGQRNGAGDAFAAGFLSVFLDNQPAMAPSSLGKALTRANILGALATQFKGDWEGIPALDELEAIISGKAEIKR